MTWRTHVLTGMSSLWLLSLLPHGVTPHNLAAVTVASALGALLPDLDGAESKVKHLRLAGLELLSPLSTVLHRSLGHRGLLHSLPGLMVLAAPLALLSPWLTWQVSCALLLGYASHLAADAATRSGIPWLYPRKRRYHILPPPFRFVTGSFAETTLLPFLALSVGLLLLKIASMILDGMFLNGGGR